MNDRVSILTKGFLDGDLKVGNRVLRRMTAGSLMLLQVLGNPLFAAGQERPDGEGEEVDVVEVSGAEYLVSLCGFLWVHSAPMEEVIAAARAGAKGRDIYEHAAWELTLNLSQEDLAELRDQFAKLNESIKAAAARGLQEEGGLPGKSVPSPIGAPALSSTSEVQVIQPKSDTSSGNCLSSGPLDISMPSAAPTVSDVHGSSKSVEEPASGILLMPLQKSETGG